jgi:hypothetical protein
MSVDWTLNNLKYSIKVTHTHHKLSTLAPFTNKQKNPCYVTRILSTYTRAEGRNGIKSKAGRSFIININNETCVPHRSMLAAIVDKALQVRCGALPRQSRRYATRYAYTTCMLYMLPSGDVADKPSGVVTGQVEPNAASLPSSSGAS